MINRLVYCVFLTCRTIILLFGAVRYKHNILTYFDIVFRRKPSAGSGWGQIDMHPSHYVYYYVVLPTYVRIDVNVVIFPRLEDFTDENKEHWVAIILYLITRS